MTHRDFKMKGKMNLEDLGDYSFELLDEISRFIRDLPNSKFITSNKFNEIFNKLEKAKKLGLNIKKYEDEIFDFRSALFLRIIDNKVNDIERMVAENKQDNSIFNIESISDNYMQLVDDYAEIKKVTKSFNHLKEVIIISKIKVMIHDIQESSKDSEYDFAKIMKELEKAKALGIDTRELEMAILGE